MAIYFSSNSIQSISQIYPSILQISWLTNLTAVDILCLIQLSKLSFKKLSTGAWYPWPFMNSSYTNSNGIRSDDLGDQLVWPYLQIPVLGNLSSRSEREVGWMWRTAPGWMWRTAPSCLELAIRGNFWAFNCTSVSGIWYYSNLLNVSLWA